MAVKLCQRLLLFGSLVSVSLAIPRDQFYSFGTGAGDSTVPTVDDGSSGRITLLSGSFPYFDREHTTLYVNTNGDISFDGPLTTFTPTSFPLDGFPLIAPYWADVDIRGTGTIYYRETRDVTLLRRARDDIMRAFSIRFQPNFLFIATWDRVGHYNSNRNRIATFQCILMTDDIMSFAKFLYADGEIQWTTGDASGGSNGLGGTPAQVGFDAGDGVRFLSVPGSQTDDIINIASTSNVNVPGVWTFRVDANIAQCDSDSVRNAPLVITPRIGSMLGGTAVSISGPCVLASDTVTCRFQGFSRVDAFEDPPDVEYDSETEDGPPVSSACVSPRYTEPGLKSLEIVVTDREGSEKYSVSTRFYATYFDDVSEVRHDQESLLIHPQTEVQVSWNPLALASMSIANPTDYTVDVYLIQFTSDGQWTELEELAHAVDNSGTANVTIPLLVGDGQEIVQDIRPVAIQIRIGFLDGRRRKQVENPPLINSLGGRVMMWTSSLYYSFSDTFRTLCADWCETQPLDIGETIVNELTPCPTQLRQARLPNSGLVEDSGISRLLSNRFFHRGYSCFRSRQASASGYGQQCCYNDTDGNLATGPPGGGTVDKVAPIGFANTLRHFQEDVIPSLWCCFGNQPTCNMYYDKRPSDNGTRYNPPNPACVYGDPHIVTLDGLKYTFNGLGEYLLSTVGDGIFTFQGRMVQATNPSGDPVRATVFSAIAMIDGDSDIIQFQTSVFPGDPEALVNGEFIDFTDVSTQEFIGGAVTKNGNTLSVRFDSGAYIEVEEENGFLATLLVSFPTSWQGLTSGLMGNYNGDTSDDLTPREGSPLPSDAGLRDIHEMFGVSWIIDRAEDSLFTYPEGQNWTTYYSPEFEPVYEVSFSNPSLNETANELCGDDVFCRFDIATTNNTMIGLSTLIGNQEFEEIVSNSRPVVCFPPCENGACVATNLCSCSAGYTGDMCETPIVTECDSSPCENNGTCEIRARSYICTCLFGFMGANCERQVVIPPPILQSVNSNTILVQVPVLPEAIRNDASSIFVYLNGRVAGVLDPLSQNQLEIGGLEPQNVYTVFLEVCTADRGHCIRSDSTVVTTPGATTEQPAQTTELPVQTTETPVQTTEPPVQTTEPPVQTTEPPVQTTEPPVQTTEPLSPITELPMPGSGSGVLPPLGCECQRSVECSIDGQFIQPDRARATGRELKCTISFSDEMIDTGSGSNFVIDESFSNDFLSAGSLAFLSNLGVLTRDEGFSDCDVPDGLQITSEDSAVIQSLTLTYIRTDGSFGNVELDMSEVQSILDYTVNRQLNEINACSFENFVQWLTSQSTALSNAECRSGERGKKTDIFFRIDCDS